ncbi:PucR family transcriptional regulator [Virgibacillus byunsanensis]|uniref:PucR family transcriptional regulator n=1 Tax=Virgibacillus byunsanensis TaxID=570945 RepID=A0ABW3LFU1_9BACI
MSITVQEAVKRPSFSNITILSGNNFLTRSFKWVHVVEKADCSNLINGGELVLTTGIEWNKDEETSLYFLKQIIDKNVAALCIDLDSKTTPLSPAFINTADSHNLPIILFNEEVKFVDITMDLHKYLLDFEGSIWDELDNLFNNLNTALNENKEVDAFLKILRDAINLNVTFYQIDEPFSSSPEQTARVQPDDNWMKLSVFVLNNEIGALYCKKKEHLLSKFEKLAIERCANFISQSLLLKYQHIERQQIEKNDWIHSIVSENADHQSVINQMEFLDNSIKQNEISMALIPFTSQNNNTNRSLSYIMLLIRDTLRSHGFHLYATTDFKNSYFIFVLINQMGSADLFERFDNAINQIKNQNKTDIQKYKIDYMSVGIFVTDYSKLTYSHKTAEKTYRLQKNKDKGTITLYQNLNVSRLLSNLANNQETQDIIQDYLGPIIEFDKQNSSSLLYTLHIYLKNQCSKKQAAEELFIVRQTLYHRLEKIASLVHYDIELPQNRFMYEFAIYAYEDGIKE